MVPDCLTSIARAFITKGLLYQEKNYPAKTLALIRLEYKKKLDAIKGNSAKEEQLRVGLANECSVKVAQAQAAYDANRAEIDLKNRLAAVEEGSEEEYHLKMVELDRQYALEVKEAEKTGADVQIIFDKYNKQILQLNQDYAKKKMDKIAGASALEQAQQDAALQTRSFRSGVFRLV